VEPIPPLEPEEAISFKELMERCLPDCFGLDAPFHKCPYQELAFKYVKEDIQN